MSDALVCLTESKPFYAQDLNENCFNFDDSPLLTTTSKNSLKSEMMDIQIANIAQDENKYAKQNCKLGDSITHKQILSRKREATNILMECVKRRENLKNIDFISNVPSFEHYNHDYSFNNSSETFTDVKAIENDNKCDFSIMPSSMKMELSISTGKDSRIEIISKSSSCHSIADDSRNNSVKKEDGKHLMDIDDIDSVCKPISDVHSSRNSLNVSPVRQSKEISAPIYEDLNCLHLTDETVLFSKDASQNSLKDIKSPVTQSLFKSVSSTIYFASKQEEVAAMPGHILPSMKWKLSSITPVLIREIVLKSGFHLLDADTTEEWLGTWGKHLKCASFKRIKNYQKVNHYPGSFHLGRKDKLWDNYRRMQIRHGSEAYNFFPETFILPADLKSLKIAWENEPDRCWILKPPASARGTGVKVIHKWSQVPKNRPAVIQRYLCEPYLINGTKFDLRVYVLVPSVEPLRIYVYEDGLVRFASQKYSLSHKSFSNRFVHLTNYSINKKSSTYTANEDENSCQGHKWSLKSFWSYLSNNGIDVSKIKEAIIDMIIKTIICSEGPICRLMKTYAKSTYNCFELFGFDVMLDKDLRPWLLEVNISPSLHTRSMLDSNVKGQLVKDMFNIVGFQVPENNNFCTKQGTPDYGISSIVANKHKALHSRYLSVEEKKKHSLYTFEYSNGKADILTNLTPDDLRCLIESEDEFNRKGSFTRIFPSESSSKYFVYFEHIRYYNLLLDAWEKSFHSDRSKGIKHLQDLCDKSLHLQND